MSPKFVPKTWATFGAFSWPRPIQAPTLNTSCWFKFGFLSYHANWFWRKWWEIISVILLRNKWTEHLPISKLKVSNINPNMFCLRSTKKTRKWCVATHWKISSSKQGSFSKFCWVKRQNSKYSATSYDGLITYWQVFSYSQKTTQTRMELYITYLQTPYFKIFQGSCQPYPTLTEWLTTPSLPKRTLNHQTKPPNGHGLWSLAPWCRLKKRWCVKGVPMRCTSRGRWRCHYGDGQVLNHPSTFEFAGMNAINIYMLLAA